MDDCMRTDKVLILIATLIVFTAVYFRHAIIDEIVTYKNLETFIDDVERSDRMLAHNPLTLEEGAELSKDLANKMQNMQNQLGNAFLLKYFVDFNNRIEDLQATIEILEQQIDAGEAFTYFETVKNNVILAIPEFSKEQVLQLATLIDKYHPSGAEPAEYQFYLIEDNPALEIVSELHPNEQFPYQQLVDHVSKDIFNGEKVFLIPGNNEDEYVEFYISENRPIQTNGVIYEPSIHPYLF